MSCVEVLAWPKRPRGAATVTSGAGSSSGGSSSVILRTSGVTTTQLSQCSRDYISLLRQDVDGLADMHLISDLSLTTPDGQPPDRLRALADEHERQLERLLPGVEAFAFTVADLYRTWPRVVWPVPGDPAFRRATEYDRPTQGWISYVHRAISKHGNLSRTLPSEGGGGGGGAVVSNLVSYYLHEPSLVLWAKRKARREYVYAGRGGSTLRPAVQRLPTRC